MCEDNLIKILWEILIKRELTNDDSVKESIDQIKKTFISNPQVIVSD